MSAVSRLYLQMIAMLDADLADLLSMRAKLRALGDGPELARLEMLIKRRQKICKTAHREHLEHLGVEPEEVA